MKKTTEYVEFENRNEVVTMTMANFISYIGAGRYTAEKIASQAEAKIYIGKRLLINTTKVKRYLDQISE